MSKKVLVGMSGGVDSSVAAYLLKERGYEVIGVTMNMWQDEACPVMDDEGNMINESQAIKDAKRVADSIGIQHHVMDFRKVFKDKVVGYFIDEYKEGRTPNPCIFCNRYVKWEALLQYGKSIGADYVATGHYARIGKYPKTGRYSICAASSQAKDQTYALYRLSQEQLEHTIMPVGEYTKDKVREIAENIDLKIAEKADSQDICFIPDGDYAKFIKEHSDAGFPEGNFVDMEGNVLGRHKGIIHYTVGQRKGLGLALGKHVYVHHIDKDKNSVVLCDNDDLFYKEVYADNVNFMAIEGIEEPVRAEAKIRYSHKKSPCTVYMENGLLKCVFDEPQRAATPGQGLVVYDGDYVLCGGTIIHH